MGQRHEVSNKTKKKFLQKFSLIVLIVFRSYSYYIEVSMDQRDWVRVVDYSNYHCRSWQRLYFSQRVVRFIRIVGTHNTVNKVFHVVALEAYYSPTIVRLEKELIGNCDFGSSFEFFL